MPTVHSQGRLRPISNVEHEPADSFGMSERQLRPPELQPRRFSEAVSCWREHRAPRKRSDSGNPHLNRHRERRCPRVVAPPRNQESGFARVRASPGCGLCPTELHMLEAADEQQPGRTVLGEWGGAGGHLNHGVGPEASLEAFIEAITALVARYHGACTSHGRLDFTVACPAPSLGEQVAQLL